MFDLITECSVDVHPQTVAAVIAVESAGDQFAIESVLRRKDRGKNTKKASETATTIEKAVVKAKASIAAGYSVSLGLMQINDMHYERFGVEIKDLFNPCINITIGTVILNENYMGSSEIFNNERDRLVGMLSGYNTGKYSGKVGRAYAERVMRKALTMNLKIKPVDSKVTLPEVTGSLAVVSQQTPQLSFFDTRIDALKSDIHLDAFCGIEEHKHFTVSGELKAGEKGHQFK